jgi:signal transduction histidine kinase
MISSRIRPRGCGVTLHDGLVKRGSFIMFPSINMVRKPPKARKPPKWLLGAYVLVTYFGVAQLSRLLVHTNTRSAPVWPPSAVGLTASLRLGKIPSAIGIFGGSMLHYAVMYFTTDRYHLTKFIAISPAFALMNSFEATACCLLVHAFSGRANKWFDSGRSALAFFLALPFAPLVTSYCFALLLVWIGLANYAHLGRLGVMFWLGRLGAMFALTPALSQIYGIFKKHRLFMFVLYIVLGGLFSFVFLGGWGVVSFTQVRLALFPAMGLLLLTSMSMDIPAVSFAILMSMIMVIWETAIGLGPFSGPEHGPVYWMVLEQSFMCVVSVKTLVITAIIREMHARNEEVNRLNGLLTTRVNYRTSESVAAMDRASDTNQQKLRFIKRVSDDIRKPLVGMQALVKDANRSSESLRALIAGTVELLLTVLDDLVNIGFAESGRLCSETMKFDPTALFHAAVGLAAPGLVDKTEWCIVEEVPHYVDGDPKTLRRCLIAMIHDCCEEAEGLSCRMGYQTHSPGHRQITRFWFEVHASARSDSMDLEEGWTPVAVEQGSAAEDRPAVLSEELGGAFFRANGGRSARLEVPLRKALEAGSYGDSNKRLAFVLG